MSKNKSYMLVAVVLGITVLSIVYIAGCYGAKPPGAQGNDGGIAKKSPEAVEKETKAIQELIDSKPDLDPLATYAENEDTSKHLKIVVQSALAEENNKDIYLMDETGHNPERLTNYASVESFPCITDDGTRVFFVSNLDGAEQINPFQIYTEIYVMDLNTREVTRLTYDERMDYGLSVTGDGSRMVYMTEEMGKEGHENPQMLLMDGDGKDQKVIQDEGLNNCLPKISGDGNWVVFNSLREGSYDIYLMDLRDPDKYTTKNLTNSFVSEYFPAINQDGTVIVFEKLLNGVQDETMYELYKIDRSGKNEVALTNDKFCDSFPTITPDGKTIIFVSKRWDWDNDGHPNEALFMMNTDGTDLKKISKDPAYFDQPDV